MLVSFRRVGDYPVYVASTMNLGELRGVWLRDLLMLTPVTLIPGAMRCVDPVVGSPVSLIKCHL
ncbi:hypothetical protein [Paraburkholderia largidicola]|uniref:Uncharacterized protein n=1 Tax=Paraburkholderia largidicola TaxID=3014751 RepID=A0A7I8C153_9BURK|nr:hypothetical protein [Paraburkholderia sp. PGU16]BCF94732.1 hypothetical protein PPGU16_77990 [Paraburkholderia sp. PGU16]